MRWRSLIRAKKPWPLFFAQCLILLGSMYVLGWWFSSHFAIGVAQGKPCMRGKIYLIERGLQPEFSHGDLIVFRTDERTTPFYKPGAKFVKVVRGVPGDHVKIDPAGNVQIDAIRVDHQGDGLGAKDYHFESALEPQVLKLLTAKHKLPASLATDYIIPKGSYFAMGTLLDSYDSRYWGLVTHGQVVGKALVVVEREYIDVLVAAFSQVIL